MVNAVCTQNVTEEAGGAAAAPSFDDDGGDMDFSNKSKLPCSICGNSATVKCSDCGDQFLCQFHDLSWHNTPRTQVHKRVKL